MNRIWYVFRAVLAGLFATQVLATLHVYLSNSALFEAVIQVKQAGYLAIPNALVAPSLKALRPAFLGGVFFTLSLGAGLSVCAAILAWVWDRILARRRARLPAIIGLWFVLVAAINSQGFSAIVTVYFLIVPFVVFVATLKWIPQEKGESKWAQRVVPVVPIVLLTVIWTAHADRFLFMDIRDFLLLSNGIGQKVDNFYYRYTLYPAQVFKTLQQKTLKTCRVTTHTQTTDERQLRRVLIDNDYLPVGKTSPVDLDIVVSEDMLALRHAGHTVVQTTLQAFLARPGQALRDFSAQTDRHGPFRQATIISLVLGFPVLLYLVVFSLFQFALGFLLSQTRSFVIAACLCFFVGLALLAPLVLGRSKEVPAGQVSEALNANRWQTRVSGLRTVVDEKLEIGRYPAYERMITSPHLPERYWLTKALGVSRRPETFPALMTLLDDPHPNMVSMAFYALGQRGDRRVVEEILKRIETSDHWYNQWYAYRALRALGWRQQKGG
jgi:hypothetical protein